MDDNTPQEVWASKKPSLIHLKVVNYNSYVHVPKENRSKLDKKVKNCIFIGYKDGLECYKLWNPKTKKVVYGWDAVFREINDVVKEEVPLREKDQRR